jgi:Mrp family chromosome partitioning ATPase
VELLHGDLIHKSADEMADLFEWGIIDAPPVNLFPDSLSLATVPDAVLLVARAGWTMP